MGVDHAAAVGCRRAGRAARAGSIPSVVRRQRRSAIRSSSSSTGWPSASRICGAVSRQVRRERDRDRAHAVDQVVEDRVELGGARLVLGELPRRGVLDVAVEPAHELPDLLERAGEVAARRSARRASPAGRRARLAAPRSVVRARHARRGSGRPSPSSARRGCRGRCRAPARSARGGRRSRRCRPGRTTPTAAPRSGRRPSRRRRPGRAGRSRCRATSRSCGRRAAGSRGRTAAAAPRSRRRAAAPASRRSGSGGCPCRAGGARAARTARAGPPRRARR